MNNDKNIFEFATRNKIRFLFKGMISVEDLWDLSVENLDSIFKVLNSQAKQVKEESLLDNKTKEDEILDIKIEIVKYIVKEKLDAADLRRKQRKNKEKKQKLLSILENKREEDLQNKSVEEIEKMINELD